MANIYKLASDYKHLQQLIEDGEITEAQATDTFDSIQEDIKLKAINSGKLIKSIEADIKARKTAMAEMRDQNSKSEEIIEAIKQRIQLAMETADIKKVDDPIMPVRIGINPPSVHVTNENDIPAFYFKTKYELDRKKLGSDLKVGKPVRGAELTQRSSLRVGRNKKATRLSD
ncbi:siphovirus Gp157 family protein [Latilactobacillus sakei]|uniref:siphovirus Gp157 family protein n=1 Tax=Latilactobacillus sakei TaxID=1599 RepID=UPI000DC64320|nr:siphovirus Gp157 family protein [Latilactobacillus sakei]SPS04281.1 Siphovirus Gp157 [Latilactobacillus sakei]